MSRRLIPLLASVAIVLGAADSVGATDAGFGFGSVHPVLSSFNEYGGALSCPAGSPATSTCYLVGSGPGGTAPAGTVTVAGEPSDYAPELVPIHNGTPGTPVPFAAGASATAISCPSGSSCDAVGYMNAADAPAFIPISNGQPGTPVSIPLSGGHVAWDDIACSTPGDCVAVGWQTTGGSTQHGVVAALTSGKASAQALSGAGQVNDVSCASAAGCVVVGSTFSPDYKGDGFFADVTGGKAGALHKVAGTGALYSIGCDVSGGTCLSYGSVNAGTKGILPVRVLIKAGSATVTTLASSAPTVSGIQCPALGECVAYGTLNPNQKGESAYLARVSGGQPGTAESVPGVVAMDDLSCPVVTSCLGVGTVKNARYGDYSIGTFTTSG